MSRGLARGVSGRDDAFRGKHRLRAVIRQRGTRAKEFTMTWTTPTATDLRFGFEITMYVSAR
jgi:coenzyme PQQ precursor peptide PqqA